MTENHVHPAPVPPSSKEAAPPSVTAPIKAPLKAVPAAKPANVKLRKRPSLSARLSSVTKAIQRSFSPIPKYPNQPTNDPQEPPTGILQDLEKLGFKDIETLVEFLKADIEGVNDDNNLLLEGLIQLLSKLPSTSADGEKLQEAFIHQLWGSLSHPPVSTLGAEFKYRSADGSGNNILVPKLGAANTPYARTTPPLVFQRPDLPDPELIFDTLMSRGDTFNPHPNKISSVLFYLATIIIHDIFQTVSNSPCAHYYCFAYTPTRTRMISTTISPRRISTSRRCMAATKRSRWR